jgi:hypothetical protein
MKVLRQLRNSLAVRAYTMMSRRPPDLTIASEKGIYLRRWWLVPRNRLLNVYLHYITGDDHGRHLHTHPWLFFISWILNGAYREETFSISSALPEFTQRINYRAGSVLVRGPVKAHRLEVDGVGLDGAALTLVITGPTIKSWGFWTEQGYVHHHDYHSDGQSA